MLSPRMRRQLKACGREPAPVLGRCVEFADRRPAEGPSLVRRQHLNAPGNGWIPVIAGNQSSPSQFTVRQEALDCSRNQRACPASSGKPIGLRQLEQAFFGASASGLGFAAVVVADQRTEFRGRPQWSALGGKPLQRGAATALKPPNRSAQYPRSHETPHSFRSRGSPGRGSGAARGSWRRARRSTAGGQPGCRRGRAAA